MTIAGFFAIITVIVVFALILSFLDEAIKKQIYAKKRRKEEEKLITKKLEDQVSKYKEKENVVAFDLKHKVGLRTNKGKLEYEGDLDLDEEQEGLEDVGFEPDIINDSDENTPTKNVDYVVGVDKDESFTTNSDDNTFNSDSGYTPSPSRTYNSDSSSYDSGGSSNDSSSYDSGNFDTGSSWD